MSATTAPPGAGHLAGIQYLRGIAATMVVIHHALEESYGAAARQWRAPDWLTTFGAAGVDIFFVISGLVMLHASFPGSGRVERPLTFLRKRATRIFPLYWLCLLGLLACWGIGFYRTLDPDPLFMLRNALLWPGERRALGVSWTLSYELYFYLVFAVVLLTRSRVAAVAGACAALAGGLLLAPILPQGPITELIGNPLVLEFAAGLVLGLGLGRLRPPPGVAWLALAAFAALMLSPLAVEHASTNELPVPQRLLAWGVPAAAIVLAFASFDRAPAGVDRRLSLLGDASYAIYLTHPFVMLAYAFALRRSPDLSEMPQPLFVVAAVVASVALGILVHRIIEQPLLRRLRTRRDRPRPPAGSGPARRGREAAA